MQKLRTARRTKLLLAAVLAGGIGTGFAVANLASAEEQAVPAVSCPSVADKLPAVPAQAQAEVARNLAQLDTQIAEANARLANLAGQGGPDFVHNAILGPLADKRKSTLDRIALAIGRHTARPDGLDALATCTLSTGGGSAPATGAPAAADPGGAAPVGGDGGAAAGPIVCPSVADKLPAVPAQAQAEVDRNLALLGAQISEANARLANSAGQGGPNFARNAILGPLADKRKSTLDRIAIAIGRHAAKPAGLDSLATCTLRQ